MIVLGLSMARTHVRRGRRRRGRIIDRIEYHEDLTHWSRSVSVACSRYQRRRRYQGGGEMLSSSSVCSSHRSKSSSVSMNRPPSDMPVAGTLLHCPFVSTVVAPIERSTEHGIPQADQVGKCFLSHQRCLRQALPFLVFGFPVPVLPGPRLLSTRPCLTRAPK